MLEEQNRYVYKICDKNLEHILNIIVGLSDITVNDIIIHTNHIIMKEDNAEHFHFLIKVPYAGKRLKWEIIFDPEDFDFAPDFDFNDDNFLENPDHNIIEDNVPSLLNWNLTDPKILSQVLNEFLLLYKKIQVLNF